MKLLYSPLLLLIGFAISCNNSGTSGTAGPANDSTHTLSTQIKKEVDDTKSELIDVQTRVQYELDSLKKLLDKDFVGEGVAAFKKVESGIGKRLSALDKIVQLQPMEQKIEKAYTEINNSQTEAVRKQKLEQFKIMATAFRDSVKATLNRINTP